VDRQRLHDRRVQVVRLRAPDSALPHSCCSAFTSSRNSRSFPPGMPCTCQTCLACRGAPRRADAGLERMLGGGAVARWARMRTDAARRPASGRGRARAASMRRCRARKRQRGGAAKLPAPASRRGASLSARARARPACAVSRPACATSSHTLTSTSPHKPFTSLCGHAAAAKRRARAGRRARDRARGAARAPRARACRRCRPGSGGRGCGRWARSQSTR